MCHGEARGEVNGSQKSAGFILWASDTMFYPVSSCPSEVMTDAVQLQA